MKTYTTPTGSFDNRDVGTSQRKQYKVKNPGRYSNTRATQNQNTVTKLQTNDENISNIPVSVASFEYSVYGFQSNGFLMFRISCSKLISLLIIVKYFIDITTIFRLTIPHRVYMYFY
jgi:hypothetical protein